METEKMIEDMPNFSFRVIDNKTGKEADAYNIALKEDWAKGLIYCDIEGFAIEEEGNLILLDECGNVAYCPSGRFTVIPEGAVVLSREEYDKLKQYAYKVQSGVCFTQKEWFDYCNEDSKNRTSLRIEAKQQARKETAREILDYLNTRQECDEHIFQTCASRLVSEDYKQARKDDKKTWREWINEIAKQFCVEVEE